jgi:hypothetical protein
MPSWLVYRMSVIRCLTRTTEQEYVLGCFEARGPVLDGKGYGLCTGPLHGEGEGLDRRGKGMPGMEGLPGEMRQVVVGRG